MTEIKLVLIGAERVGKSALTVQFLRNHFIESYETTIQDSYQKQLVIDGEVCHIEILDTSGNEYFKSMRDKCIHEAEGFLCVFDSNENKSLDFMDSLIPQIKRQKGSDQVPMILVCNKTDLLKQVVAKRDGILVADSHEIPYIETSAKTRQGVDESFNYLIRAIKAKQKMEQSLRKKIINKCSIS